MSVRKLTPGGDSLQRDFQDIARSQRGQDETLIVAALRSAVRRYGGDHLTEHFLCRCARAARIGQALPAM